MSSNGIDQELKGVSLLKKACSGNREQPCGEELAFLGLVSEADFSPHHRRSDSPLGSVIGWLHTLMFKECEQMIPMFEQPTGSSCHIGIGTQLVGLEASVHSCSKRDRFFHKGTPIFVYY